MNKTCVVRSFLFSHALSLSRCLFFLIHVFPRFAMAHFWDVVAVFCLWFIDYTDRFGFAALHIQFILFAHIVRAIIFSTNICKTAIPVNTYVCVISAPLNGRFCFIFFQHSVRHAIAHLAHKQIISSCFYTALQVLFQLILLFMGFVEVYHHTAIWHSSRCHTFVHLYNGA